MERQDVRRENIDRIIMVEIEYYIEEEKLNKTRESEKKATCSESVNTGRDDNIII